MPGPTFGHGANAGALFNGRDLTRFTTNFNYAADIDQEEQTTLQASGGSKEYLYGNNGASAGLDGRLANSLAHVQRELAPIQQLTQEGKLFLLAPFGFNPGNWVIQFLSKKSTFRAGGGLTSTVTTGSTFISDGEEVIGTMLQAPRIQGGATINRNEIQQIVFASAPTNQVLAFRANGTTTLSATFTLGAYANDAARNAAFKALIEALPSYAGRTATLTGALTGTGSKSGTLPVTFDGTVNLPQVEVVSAVLQTIVIASGTTANKTVNGVTITTASTAATVQADFQAKGGQYAGATVTREVRTNGDIAYYIAYPMGATPADVSAPVITNPAQSYVVANCGEVSLRNTYPIVSNTARNGGPVYNDGVGHVIWNQGNTWVLTDVTAFNSPGLGNIFYQVAGSPTAQVPSTGWAVSASPAPVPTVSVGIAGSTSPDPSVAVLNIVQGLATDAAGSTSQEGGAFNGLQLISVATNGTAIKTAMAPHQNGATLDLHATYTTTSTLSVPVLVQHAPDSSGSPGAWATLGTFTTITSATDDTQLAQRLVVPAGTTINPWKRIVVGALTGQVALGVAVADKAAIYGS